MMTDVQLAGKCVELAHIARKYNPDRVIVTRPAAAAAIARRAQFWAKPWAPLDVIREAERMASCLLTSLIVVASPGTGVLYHAGGGA